MSFRERFGLDYLKRSNDPVRSDSMPDGLEDAVLAFGAKVMAELKREPEKTTRVFDLTDRISLRIDSLLPVINYLTSKGYIEIVETDRQGNDFIRLSEAGKKFPVI